MIFIFAFNLAVIVIYLALAAQFESFTDPLTIMATMPLALTGAFGDLWLAGILRFRQVLMTAISTIFGMIPIAFATGAGAESRSPLGIVVIGGMFLSTLLTQVVIPVVHILVQNSLQSLASRFRNE